MKSYLALVKEAGADWVEDHASRLAASLAFYTMLSIAPLLVIAIKVVGVFFGDDAAKTQIRNYLTQLMGPAAGDAVGLMMGPIAKPGAGTFATIVSLIILFFSASGVFGELQDSLNTIWEVKPRPNRPWWSVIRERSFSFVLVLGSCFILLVSLVISTTLAAVTHTLGAGEHGILWNVGNFAASITIITALFALIFKYIPDAKVGWRDVWFGAIATGVLFTVGKFLLGWYLGRSTTTSIYGAAGSLVAMLLWIYYSSQILFFGTELTQAHSRLAGRRVEPTENAVKMTTHDRMQQGIVSDQTIKAAERRQDRKQGAGESTGSGSPLVARAGRAVLAAPRPSRKTQVPQGKLKDYAFAAGGAVVGVLAGGLAVEYFFHDARKPTRKQAAAVRLDDRIHRVEESLGRVARMTRGVQDPATKQRLQQVAGRVCRAADRARQAVTS